MRKANKIMMATVSTLLTLTLISSCILSGLYAKYVTKEDSKVTVSFKKFGVTVEATVDPNLVALSEEASAYKGNENEIGYTFTKISLAPGDDFAEAVKFKITGTADVPLRVKVYIDGNYTAGNKSTPSRKDDFWVNDDIAGVKIGGDYKGDTFMPIDICFTAKDVDGQVVINHEPLYKPWTSMASYNTDRYMQMKLCTLIDIPFNDITKTTIAKSGGRNTGYVFKDFNAGEPIVFHKVTGAIPDWQTSDKISIDTTKATVHKDKDINELCFGLYWPLEYSRGNIDFDQLSMFLLEYKTQAKYSVTFRIEIEQIQPS